VTATGELAGGTAPECCDHAEAVTREAAARQRREDLKVEVGIGTRLSLHADDWDQVEGWAGSCPGPSALGLPDLVDLGKLRRGLHLNA